MSHLRSFLLKILKDSSSYVDHLVLLFSGFVNFSCLDVFCDFLVTRFWKCGSWRSARETVHGWGRPINTSEGRLGSSIRSSGPLRSSQPSRKQETPSHKIDSPTNTALIFSCAFRFLYSFLLSNLFLIFFYLHLQLTRFFNILICWKLFSLSLVFRRKLD